MGTTPHVVLVDKHQQNTRADKDQVNTRQYIIKLKSLSAHYKKNVSISDSRDLPQLTKTIEE